MKGKTKRQLYATYLGKILDFLKFFIISKSTLKSQKQLWDVNITDKNKRVKFQKGKWMAQGNKEQRRDFIFKSSMVRKINGHTWRMWSLTKLTLETI